MVAIECNCENNFSFSSFSPCRTDMRYFYKYIADSRNPLCEKW